MWCVNDNKKDGFSNKNIVCNLKETIIDKLNCHTENLYFLSIKLYEIHFNFHVDYNTLLFSNSQLKLELYNGVSLIRVIGQ